MKVFDEDTYETVQISDFTSEHSEQADTEFVFASYTRLQFRVVSNEEINAYEYPDEANREANRRIPAEDRAKLFRRALDAAHAARKRAFCLDFARARDADGLDRATSSSEDVYRICDIVHVSHSMITGTALQLATGSLLVAAARNCPSFLQKARRGGFNRGVLDYGHFQSCFCGQASIRSNYMSPGTLMSRESWPNATLLSVLGMTQTLLKIWSITTRAPRSLGPCFSWPQYRSASRGRSWISSAPVTLHMPSWVFFQIDNNPRWTRRTLASRPLHVYHLLMVTDVSWSARFASYLRERE